MNNAEKFKQIFGLYATELWSMPESDFLEWLNRDVETTQIDHTADIGKKAEKEDCISRRAAIDAMNTWDKFGCAPNGMLVRYDDNKHYVPYVRYDDMVYVIKSLPPAQPDHVADISKKVEGDCISRQAAVVDFMAFVKSLNLSRDDYRAMMEYIDELSAVQPERKKGRWLRYGEDGYPNNEDTVFWQCDQCLEQYTGRTKRIPNFCPNCGADMRGGQE